MTRTHETGRRAGLLEVVQAVIADAKLNDDPECSDRSRIPVLAGLLRQLFAAAPTPEPVEGEQRLKPQACIDDLQTLYEWIREPDWAEQFGDKQLVSWLNKRPCASPLAAQAMVKALADSLATSEAARKAAEAERDEAQAQIAVLEEELQARIAVPKAGNVLRAVVKAFHKSSHQTVDELLVNLPNFKPKEIYNALGYLTLKGRIIREGQGKYAAALLNPTDRSNTDV